MGRVAFGFIVTTYNSKTTGIHGSKKSLPSIMPPACDDCSDVWDTSTLSRRYEWPDCTQGQWFKRAEITEAWSGPAAWAAVHLTSCNRSLNLLRSAFRPCISCPSTPCTSSKDCMQAWDWEIQWRTAIVYCWCVHWRLTNAASRTLHICNTCICILLTCTMMAYKRCKLYCVRMQHLL